MANPRPHPLKWFVCTDGACAPTNPGPCGWGAVLVEPGGSQGTDHYGFIGPGTNQIGELHAALGGLLLVPVGAEVDLVSDSQYVLKGLSEWRKGWERNGWRNSKKEPVANADIWKALFAVVDQRKVATLWVKGHNGDHYNERADALANRALRLRSSTATRVEQLVPVAMRPGESLFSARNAELF